MMKGLLRVLAVSPLAAIATWATVVAQSADPPQETSTPVQARALSDVPGKRLVMATIDYPPGGASTAHRHPGSVFAYVLQGDVESQLEGQPATIYHAGQSWYEPPMAPHVVSRNASTTQPARLLAVLVLDESAPLKQALPQRGGR